MAASGRNGASFRDPSGFVWHLGDRIFRVLSTVGAENWLRAKDCGLIDRLQQERMIVSTRDVAGHDLPDGIPGETLILEHDRLPFISYSYEWPFQALKAAALHHLKVHQAALEYNFTLSDASSFNIQFDGPDPVFIDTSSFVPYSEGSYWHGYAQFCEQFLNPLVLFAKLGVAHNAIIRGAMSGLKTQDLDRLMKMPDKLSPLVLFNVGLLARAERQTSQRAKADRTGPNADSRRPLPKKALLMMLQGLERGISRLQLKKAAASTWGRYAGENSYSGDEDERKKQFIAEFAARFRPKLLWDLGCNTGVYSSVALQAGAGRVIGFDSDTQAVEAAFARARDGALAFLPLYMDLSDPSPDQGWRGAERMSLQRRASADALLALAVVHQLAIGRNIPLAEVIAWIVSLAPMGVIEFVQKSDPTVGIMLAGRDDIFDSYTEETFRSALRDCATIVDEAQITAHGRTLFTYRTQ